MTTRTFSLVALGASMAFAIATGCASKNSGGGGSAPPDETIDDAGSGGYGGDSGVHKDASMDAPGDGKLDCTLANEGCPCADAGATTECKIYFQVGDYKACTIGEATCSDAGTWSACAGNKLGGDAGK